MTRTRFSGSAIVITLLAVAAITTVALGVAQLVPQDFRQTQSLESSIMAEDAAWSGIEQGLYLVKTNPYYQISNSYDPLSPNPLSVPYAKAPTSECMNNPSSCPGVDRQLGLPVNQDPRAMTLLDPTKASTYSITTWHLAEKAGNVADINYSVNPTLARDGIRRLDMQHVTSSVTLQWKPYDSGAGCDVLSASSQFHVVATWLNADGSIVSTNGSGLPDANARFQYNYNPSAPFDSETILKPSATAAQLELRFLATNPSDSAIQGCAMRYTLQGASINGSNGDLVDIGFNVIESIGVSGGVRRKVRVLADRENGKLINILDFGLACETCNLGQ